MFSAYTCRLTLILLFVNCLQTFLSLEAEIQKEEEYSCDQISKKYFFVSVHCNNSNYYPWKGECLVQIGEVLDYKEARSACIEGRGDLATFAEDGGRPSSRFNKRKNYWVGLRPNLLMWNASGKLTAAKMICMVNYSNDMLVKVWQEWLVIQSGLGNLRGILSQSPIVYLRNHSRNCFNICCMVL